jgi:predicted  nucleic acid-binding Zn-ribbon protein
MIDNNNSEKSPDATEIAYTLGKIDANINWLNKKIEELDSKISGNNEKVNDWRDQIQESVLNLKTVLKN